MFKQTMMKGMHWFWWKLLELFVWQKWASVNVTFLLLEFFSWLVTSTCLCFCWFGVHSSSMFGVGEHLCVVIGSEECPSLRNLFLWSFDSTFGGDLIKEVPGILEVLGMWLTCCVGFWFSLLGGASASFLEVGNGWGLSWGCVLGGGSFLIGCSRVVSVTIVGWPCRVCSLCG